MVMNMDKTSMLYWYPKIKDLDIPQPETEIVRLNMSDEEYLKLCDYDFKGIMKHWDEIIKSAEKIGFPLFMRTDVTSNKHDWLNSCYVKNPTDLKEHIANIVEFSFLADITGLPINAIVFRKYIPMKTLFRAFHGDMPVNPEIRFFIKDGEVLCWHWYWIEDAIEKGTKKEKLPFDWKSIIRQQKESLSGNDILWLTNDARKVAGVLPGFWSVDFCQGKDGTWYLIDMAEAEKSWHPGECKFHPKNMR